ncbi:hypothetical protein CQ14_39980 [Bradyrhizobium lablabi]|uniref:Uncharacterized protein n=1 Tax=Bradyrhizobium lablabi TaxID=722472 RepID=A0A0R3MJP7_9BRAD|nr:hypothetical protein CQ14_39980 [Bradyrhizobium lablabi]
MMLLCLTRFRLARIGLSPAEVTIGRSEVIDALMKADVIVVFDEGPYLVGSVGDDQDPIVGKWGASSPISAAPLA